jgi:undecaprenyl-diphosphatase
MYPFFDKLMHAVSKLFDVGLYTTLMAAVFLGMIYSNAPLKGPLMLFSIAQIITYIIKRIFGRDRPFVILEDVHLGICPPKDVYSFPSGHTTAAVTLALMIAMWMPFLTPYFVVLAVLCGISRIYLGVHYPTDVLIGAIIPIFTKLLIG